ncbi:MAG: hypothetical protein JXR53_06930 [Bacteroidales bacterium]|nr:hypothetical protein [Bacteroidales bacterium]
MEEENKKYVPKHETLKSLAALYGIDWRTLKRQLEPIKHKIRYKEENRRKLTPREVKYIVDYLGEPGVD